MDEFTRKFDAAEDKEQRVHYVLTTVYESLKKKDRGLYPVGRPHVYHQPQLGAVADLQDRPGRAAAGAGEELFGAVNDILFEAPPEGAAL